MDMRMDMNVDNGHYKKTKNKKIKEEKINDR